MLQIYENLQVCSVVLNFPLSDDDTTELEKVFSKEHEKWSLEFGSIYTINRKMVNLLYEEIFEKHKNIAIITHKNKLNTYLHGLGFTPHFISLIKGSVVSASEIEVVLIGGSADSSQKILNIVKNTRLENLALVIVQHVEPQRVGQFDEILQQYTANQVCYASDGQKIKKGVIYIAPNNRHLKVKNGCFVLSDDAVYHFSKPSISVSYESFSSCYKESLLIIQECGYGDDGVDKLKFLAENNSKIIIQNEEECSAKPMVMNALRVNVHNYVFNLENIIFYINFLNKKESKENWVEYLLEMIYKIYNYDFRLYHRDMVQRRIEVFMIKHSINNLQDAVGAILFNKNAFKVFFLELSINVTEFFRNPESFKDIAELLNKSHKNKHNIKVWSAGCSTGKEAYSIAILLESLGLLKKSIIYATDFNSVVIADAKNATYSNKAYEIGFNNFEKIGLNDNLNNYVTKNDNFITITEKIREKTLFFQHNLLTDSSFNEFDIIICKNVIIYFGLHLQKKVFGLFYDSLKFGGHLILGESESVHPDFSENFKQSSKNCKIFIKVK